MTAGRRFQPVVDSELLGMAGAGDRREPGPRFGLGSFRDLRKLVKLPRLPDSV